MKMYKRIYRLFTGNPYWLESLIDENRLQFLSMLAVKSALETKGREGAILELGVYRGGSLYAIMKALKIENLNNEVFGLDTFKGLPKGETWKNSNRLKHNSFEKVIKEFDKRKLYPILISGEFEFTLSELKDKKFCFVHFDCDLYNSYDIGLKFVLPRLNKRGIVFFDDYNSKYATQSNSAIHKHIKEKDLIILPNKQAYYQK